MESFSRTAKIVNLASLPLWYFIAEVRSFFTLYLTFSKEELVILIISIQGLYHNVIMAS